MLTPEQKAVGDAIVAVVKPLVARIAALEHRPTLQYRGVWRDGTEYAAGSFVTHSGSVWYASATTRARPNDGPDWVLAVKRGADGKDLR